MIRSTDILTRNFDVLGLKQENLSGNAANVRTPGFKYQQLIQSTLPGATAYNHTGGANNTERNELGEFIFGNQIDESLHSMENGALQETLNPTDFAVMGDGFFTVDGPDGEMYTKNGQFTVNNAGELMTPEGYPVQTTGNIVFDENTKVDQYGYINGTDAQLVINRFDDLENLTTVDGSYFTGGGAVQAEGDLSIYQGYLESSNIDMADVMVDMMEISREYEANQKVLQATNESLQQATNQVGKV